MRSFLVSHSGFSASTVNNVIKALGYPLKGSGNIFQGLCADFINCAEHGADNNFSGFCNSYEMFVFFRKNHVDIINHMVGMAAEIGTDVISMIQEFNSFRHTEKPTPSDVGKALWDNRKYDNNLSSLYDVFAWYALEEMSRTWYVYLEENPGKRQKLSA
jgi:hypothetical protein